MAARQQRDFVRRLVVARCPELSLDEIEAAFGMDYTYTDDVLAEIADAVTDAVEAFEARLDRLESAGGCNDRRQARWVVRGGCGHVGGSPSR